MANRVTLPVTNFETLSPPWSLQSLDNDLLAGQTGFNDSSLGWVNGIPTDTGGANAYVVATLPFGVPTAYNQGFTIVFIPANTNTGASTINVAGLGLKAIVNSAGGALAAGQLQANRAAMIVYDGTSFRLISEDPGADVFGVPTDTGTSANVYIVAPPVPPLAYVAGMMVVWIPIHTNTGASTINVSGLGAQNINDIQNNALVAGALIANRAYVICYDGTNFRLMTPTYGTNIYVSSSFSNNTQNAYLAITGWAISFGAGLGVTYDGASGFTLTGGASIAVLNVTQSTGTAATVLGARLLRISGSGQTSHSLSSIPVGANVIGSCSQMWIKGDKFETDLFAAGGSGSITYTCTLSILTIPF